MANEGFLAQLKANADRFEEIKHLGDRVERTGSHYARTSYRVKLDDETRKLSDHDLVVLCDDGNACFGGHVGSRFGDAVAVDVYTDWLMAVQLTTRALRERVELGMTWLDARHPGWHDLIDLDRLDVSSPCNCLLGQTIGGFDLHAARLDIDQAAALGFDASSSHDDMADEYAALTEVWRTVIERRRATRHA